MQFPQAAETTSQTNQIPTAQEIQAYVQQLVQQTLANQRLAPAPVGRTKEPKVAEVNKFNGVNRYKLDNFIGSCETVFEIQPSSFSTDKQKILFVGAHLLEAPLTWFRINYVDNRAALSTKAYVAFKEELLKYWGDPNAKVTANRKLTKIYQGKRTIAEYAAEFKQYSGRSSWAGNETGLIEFFKMGLGDNIKRDLFRGREALPTNLEAMILLCVDIENLQQEYREDNRNWHTKPNTPSNSNNRWERKEFKSNNLQKSNSGFQPSSSRNPSFSDAMDVDAIMDHGHLKPEVLETRRKDNLCLYCGEKGHKVANCPKTNKSRQVKPQISGKGKASA